LLAKGLFPFPALELVAYNFLTKENPFLSQLQCRILAAISLSKLDSLTSDVILRETGIAQSTWSEEQKRLVQLGLLEKKPSKMMISNTVTRVMKFRLTDKGKLVALNLANISRILGSDQFSYADAASVHTNENTGSGLKDKSELDDEILECIEIGLDSFGMNLDNLVRSEIEKSEEVSWNKIARHPERLVVQLKELFGVGGSTVIESMIAANLRSRFGLKSINSDSISSLIAELRLSSGKLRKQSETEKQEMFEEVGTPREVVHNDSA
jgi:DNA-binding MarR family transcriptional regulator